MIPEFPQFKGLELSDKAEVEKVTQKYPPYSDFNFISMWCWDIKGDMRVSMLNGNLVVRFTDYINGQPFFSFLGDNLVNETVETLLEFSKKEGLEAKLKLIPEVSIKNLDEKRFNVAEARDQFDYIYNLEELNRAENGKYETYRNMVNRFSKRHLNEEITVKVLPLDPIIKEDILKLNSEWEIKKAVKVEGVDLKNEANAMNRIYSRDQGLIVVGIFNKNELIAYSINELLESGYAICHFAKANIIFAGIYPFLMKQTGISLVNLGRNFLNYEQDLGLPNLRQSKRAYNPSIFLKKYSITSTKFSLRNFIKLTIIPSIWKTLSFLKKLVKVSF